MEFRHFRTGPGRNCVVGGCAGVAAGGLLLLFGIRNPSFGLLGLITLISGWGLVGIGILMNVAHQLERRIMDLEGRISGAGGAQPSAHDPETGAPSPDRDIKFSS
jgi:hypothetical protein